MVDCLWFSIVDSVSARMLKVLGSIPGQSINPFCRCPHFLRSGRSRGVRIFSAAGALAASIFSARAPAAEKMRTSTKGIYGLSGDRTEYFQLRS